jgi:hypothetical protein
MGVGSGSPACELGMLRERDEDDPLRVVQLYALR